LEEVTLSLSHDILMEVDDNVLLIVGDPQGILDQHLRLCQIHFLNIILYIDNLKI
jgi:hypothetical protein